MKISLETFCHYIQKFDFKEIEISAQYTLAYAGETVWGSVMSKSGKPLCSYSPDEDRWYSFEEDLEDFGNQEIEFNIHNEGVISFNAIEDIDILGSNIFYNPSEFYDFLKIQSYASESILNKSVSFKEFKIRDVIDEIFISVSTGALIYFRPLSQIKGQIDPDIFELLIKCIFEGDFSLLESEGCWNSFCEKHQLIKDKESMVPTEKIPVIINKVVFSNTSRAINSAYPYLGISVKESFSSQYFFDFLGQSKDGKVFMENLKSCILNNQSINSLSISAPNSFVHQIKYSTEFRLQYQVYKNEVISNQNHLNESIIDLKVLYKNRRENIKKFILNKENATFLDVLRNPLPYNLEKSYRTYVRAANDLDRLTYAGKLYNLILRSAVFYPLEEMIHLGLEKNHKEILEIIAEIRGDKPISDGTWLNFFNTIASVWGKNNLKLNYFSTLIQAVQLEYKNIQEIIPQRNDWAHYREHSADFLKSLDEFLPKVLSILRNALNGNTFLMVEGQNYKKDGLYITAKKIMGYEVDIETVEFKTLLEGKHFIQDSLVVYNEKAAYTIPLENFFRVRIVQSEAVQMGIYKGGASGESDYEY